MHAPIPEAPCYICICIVRCIADHTRKAVQCAECMTAVNIRADLHLRAHTAACQQQHAARGALHMHTHRLQQHW